MEQIKYFEKIKQKLKKNPDYIKSKGFAKWRDKNYNELTFDHVIEMLECMPKDYEIDTGYIFKENENERIIECSITSIQRNRNVGYPTAKKIFMDKQIRLDNLMQTLTPTLKEITKELLKEKDYVDLIKSIITDESLANANDEEIQELISSYYHNNCRGYIVKTLTLKYLYETYYYCSNMFLDKYWREKLGTIAK